MGSAATIISTLQRLRGPWEAVERVSDVHSLSTHHLLWADGLRVEVKTQQLGEVAPWSHCQPCFFKARCREGIFALRLTHQGELRLCMDRPDLQLPLGALVQKGKPEALQGWREFVAKSLG